MHTRIAGVAALLHDRSRVQPTTIARSMLQSHGPAAVVEATGRGEQTGLWTGRERTGERERERARERERERER